MVYSRKYSLSAYFRIRDMSPNYKNCPTMNIVCVHAQCNSRQVTRPQSARTVRTSHENKAIFHKHFVYFLRKTIEL